MKTRLGIPVPFDPHQPVPTDKVVISDEEEQLFLK